MAIDRSSRPRATNVVALVCLLAVYVCAVISLHPTNYFGLFEDDSIYFSSAKSLAQGQGYVLPSVPGTPPATKYPILYPLILSLVWRWNPSFPGNLSAAVGITVAFGLAYIIAGFFFLRRSEEFNNSETVFLTAFCALHPLVLFFSANVLSDIPFAALALTAMVLADKFLKSSDGNPVAIVCGIVVGLSVLMRVFGAAVAAGIVIAALAMRAWKKMFVFSASVAPFFLIIAWRNIFSPPVTISIVSGSLASNLGWARAWAYYTNYLAIWRYGVPNAHIFWAMVRNNLELVVQAPADLFLSPLLVSDTIAGRALILLVSTLALGGIVRQAWAKGWQAAHYMFPVFVISVLCWNYSDAGNRFLLPFYFIFAAGLWIEMKHLFALLRTSLLGERCSAGTKVLALTLSVSVLALCAGIICNYGLGRRRDLYVLSDQRARTLGDKQEAYRWLAQNGCCAPVLAVEDANLYLYSGRTAVSPVLTFPTSTLYDQTYLDDALNHVTDIANAVGAGFWVFADDDFNMESKNVATAVRSCFGATGPKRWPVVFASSDGHVVIRSMMGVPSPASPCQEPSPKGKLWEQMSTKGNTQSQGLQRSPLSL